MNQFLPMLPAAAVLILLLYIIEGGRIRHKRRIERNYQDFKNRAKR
jgi:hypothetical protein